MLPIVSRITTAKPRSAQCALWKLTEVEASFQNAISSPKGRLTTKTKIQIPYSEFSNLPHNTTSSRVEFLSKVALKLPMNVINVVPVLTEMVPALRNG